MPEILLVYDGCPDPERIRADAARILAEHNRRQAEARRDRADRGRAAVRRVLVERLCSTIQLHALARRARAEVQL